MKMTLGKLKQIIQEARSQGHVWPGGDTSGVTADDVASVIITLMSGGNLYKRDQKLLDMIGSFNGPYDGVFDMGMGSGLLGGKGFKVTVKESDE